MRLSLTRSRAGPGLLLSSALALVCLALAIAASLALAELLLSPTGRDLRALALYLIISGGVTLTVGWAGLRLADGVLHFSIQAKVLVSALVGTGIGLLNVFVVAKLMFISNAHDLRLLAALLVFSAALTSFFNIWVAVTTTSRLERAANALRTLAEGDYMAKVSVDGRDEAAQLGARVNELAERLRESEEARAALERERRELTAAASHDLRTPLSSLRAMVDALEDGVVEDRDEVARYYSTMGRELNHLSRMVDDLFELAQIDAGALRLSRRSAALQDIAADVVDAMHAEAVKKGIRLSLSVAGTPPLLSVDGVRIERAISNLVRNALEHTSAGGEVTLSIESDEDAVEASVVDTGEGINPEHLPRIWDRFYRADPSRLRRGSNVDGAGLGLAIVRGVVEAHGGFVAVTSQPSAGSTFTITLPLDSE